jgi:6-phosphofructokinase 1
LKNTEAFFKLSVLKGKHQEKEDRIMNIAVAQSGGPTCAINSSLVGVIKEAKLNNIKRIYGAKNGIYGVIKDCFCDLGAIADTEDKLKLLRETPSTALGSCRIKLEPCQYPGILANLEKRGIGAFFYIGGNDSMDTVSKLHDYAARTGSKIKFAGIPKTIDNDLPETDHTPGFGSAAKYIAATVKEIIADSNVYNIKSVTIIEIMGRDAGWLTASTCVLDDILHLSYLPEKPFSLDRFINDIKLVQEEKRAVIVAVSEGLKDVNGEYTAAANQSGKSDVFGHRYLAGLGKFLEHKVSQLIGCKVRSVELNVCQRCACHIASATDLNEAQEVAQAAVREVLNNNNHNSGIMMTIQRVSDSPYKVQYKPVDVKLCANRVKRFPEKWINAQGNGVLPRAKGYFMPLIQGEINARYKDGIPVHFIINDDEFNK